MSDSAKKAVMIAVAVVAVAFAAFMGFRSMNAISPREEVVGELPMPEGGGKAAEMGSDQVTGASDPSGMPAGAGK